MISSLPVFNNKFLVSIADLTRMSISADISTNIGFMMMYVLSASTAASPIGPLFVP